MYVYIYIYMHRERDTYIYIYIYICEQRGSARLVPLAAGWSRHLRGVQARRCVADGSRVRRGTQLARVLCLFVFWFFAWLSMALCRASRAHLRTRREAGIQGTIPAGRLGCFLSFIGWSNNHLNNLRFKSSLETNKITICFK